MDSIRLLRGRRLRFSLLRAFRRGMVENGVQGLRPIIGKEVEEMKLEGYTPLEEELAEDFGVATKGAGRASYVFDGPGGTYDVRVTYFDERGGKASVALRIAGKERAAFLLDEEADCWRHRTFRGIRVRRGDRIELVGRADRGDRAILDFVEFLRR